MSKPATFRINWIKPPAEEPPKVQPKRKPPKQPAQPPQLVQPVNYGPPLWKELHEQALSGSLPDDWLKAFELRLPCGQCRQHWQEMVRQTPPKSDFFEWSVNRHNEVNRKLGKPELTLSQAAAIWKK